MESDSAPLGSAIALLTKPKGAPPQTELGRETTLGSGTASCAQLSKTARPVPASVHAHRNSATLKFKCQLKCNHAVHLLQWAPTSVSDVDVAKSVIPRSIGRIAESNAGYASESPDSLGIWRSRGEEPLAVDDVASEKKPWTLQFSLSWPPGGASEASSSSSSSSPCLRSNF